MMPMYARIADKETGVCYLGKFAQNLGIKECEATNRLFNVFDTEVRIIHIILRAHFVVLIGVVEQGPFRLCYLYVYLLRSNVQEISQ